MIARTWGEIPVMKPIRPMFQDVRSLDVNSVYHGTNRKQMAAPDARFNMIGAFEKARKDARQAEAAGAQTLQRAYQRLDALDREQQQQWTEIRGHRHRELEGRISQLETALAQLRSQRARAEAIAAARKRGGLGFGPLLVLGWAGFAASLILSIGAVYAGIRAVDQFMGRFGEGMGTAAMIAVSGFMAYLIADNLGIVEKVKGEMSKPSGSFESFGDR